MSKRLEDRYLKALSEVSLADLSEATGRAYRTLQSYRRGERRVTLKAARELVAFLRSRAKRHTAVADALEAAADREESNAR